MAPKQGNYNFYLVFRLIPVVFQTHLAPRRLQSGPARRVMHKSYNIRPGNQLECHFVTLCVRPPKFKYKTQLFRRDPEVVLGPIVFVRLGGPMPINHICSVRCWYLGQGQKTTIILKMCGCCCCCCFICVVSMCVCLASVPSPPKPTWQKTKSSYF